MQKVTIRVLTVNQIKQRRRSPGGPPPARSLVRRPTGGMKTRRRAQRIYNKAVRSTSVETEPPKNVPPLQGAIYQHETSNRRIRPGYDLQRLLGPCSWNQDIRTKRSHVHFCFWSVSQPEQAVTPQSQLLMETPRMKYLIRGLNSVRFPHVMHLKSRCVTGHVYLMRAGSQRPSAGLWS